MIFDRGPGLEAAKWLAFLLMIGDHVNTHVLDGAYPILYLLGRLVFPLFAFALAAGVAEKGEAVLVSTINRLLVWACVAQVPWSYFSHPVSLNVIFTLAFGLMAYSALVVKAWNWKRGVLYVVAAAASLGSASEFGLIGVLLVASCAWAADQKSRIAFCIAAALLLALGVVNHTWTAILAVPAFIACVRLWEVPRVRHVFYWLYPAHFAVLAAWRVASA